MRIGLVARRLDPDGGGTERDLMVTAQLLRAAGHDITFCADEVRSDTREWRVVKVPTLKLGRAIRLLTFATRAVNLARAAGCELVVSFARVVGADVMRSGGSAHSSYLRAARQWRGAMGGIAMQASPYHRVQIAVERAGFRSAAMKLAIAVSDLVREDLVRELGVPAARAVTLYNGVDLDRFHPSPGQAEREAIRRELGIGRDAHVAVFIGNGFGRKGLGALLEAWPLLKNLPHLVVAGADRRLARYQERALTLRVAERTHFLGPQPNVERLFHGADLLVLPSFFEPFGNVVMEAMASGLPVLVSRHCGAAEALPEVMKRFVIDDPSNPSEIATRLQWLFDAAADLREVSRNTAAQFTWQRYGTELRRLLEDL